MMKGTKVVPHTTSSSVIIHIDSHPFLLNQVKAVVQPLEGPERYVPATYLYHDGMKTYSPSLEEDDAWSKEDFSEVLTHQALQGVTLPVGPYIIHSSSGRVYSILRLYDDFSNAFVGGVLEDGPLRYKWFLSTTKIPVPPRLYNTPCSPDKPLKGWRFGVKDSIDVAGLETGNGSKCYRELYPPRESTAVCIARLIAAGAVLVGKMRCCQWCDGQDPLERLEEVTPTNPRGDAFQKPSGSSSGSAAGCASYEWLDFTIGTDTGGSVRHPAGVNGLYGIRPSMGSMDSSGLICAASMDTPGVFARSPRVAEAVSRVMMGSASMPITSQKGKKRYRLLYAVEPASLNTTEAPKFFSPERKGLEASTAAGKIMEMFVCQLEEYLDSKRQEVCIFDLWKETHAEGTSGSLLEATGDIYKNIVYGQLSRDVVQPFEHEYEEAYGRKPFIEAKTKARLDYGARIADRDLGASIQAFHNFANWVNTVLLARPPDDDGIVPLLLYPQIWGIPQYRDDLGRATTGQVFWNGFSAYSLSYCSGAPDYTLPLGEVGFNSKITGRVEYLPVAISLMGPRDMDETMLGLIRDLETIGILRPVQCGPRLWPDAETSA